MIQPTAHLADNLFAKDIEKKPTRDGFGTGTVAAGKKDKNVVVLCADLKESTRAEWFEKEFPDRFVEIGVAEQNLATVGSGMAAVGKVPFVASYAAFSPGRNYEQIRTTIALNQQHVIVCGMHAGVSVGPDGATHQMLEDIGLMRMLPGMTVLVPGDALEAHKAVVAAATHNGPVYIRFGRTASPVFSTEETPFEIGKAVLLWDHAKPRVAIMSTGTLSYQALLAAKALAAEGTEVSVLHVPTVKPLDTEAVLALAKRAGRIITVEEHQTMGGFGSAIAECVSEHYPVPVHRMGVQDLFGQSGDPDELMQHYGLSATHIVEAVRS
ncbi:transketolase family protein [Patescibacteria group bacterium]|nr:transketolase family protein [Patescibacteria group bacterium]MBU1501100.1 transketolase family protein [Patescibacteria group bacterium]MBU2081027.1 transketolase family protein [Patescibacteria group bacterium]MBU2124118.1 transketolase family protein [Patescibacteria group bacterium]MBU2194974.1 transketolase family protein [Patescibacteria group bacterium]